MSRPAPSVIERIAALARDVGRLEGFVVGVAVTLAAAATARTPAPGLPPSGDVIDAEGELVCGGCDAAGRACARDAGHAGPHRG